MKYTPYQWSSALGCMLGQACGDALGTTLEFKSADRCQELYPQGLRDIVGGGAFNVEPGQVTDDTEMAMALARSLTAEGVYQMRVCYRVGNSRNGEVKQWTSCRKH